MWFCQIDSNTTVETFERAYIGVDQHIELRTAQVNRDITSHLHTFKTLGV
jgi:hypothetical protein